MSSQRPTDLLHGVRASTADLVQSLGETHWTDADVASPCLLPDWTLGHLLTHLARNADSVAGTLAAALHGEVRAQYPGGREQRQRDIEAGAGRPLAVQLADVRESAEKLDRVLGAVDDAEAWDAPAGDGVPAAGWLPRRWREVEIHRVDLDAGYTPDRWPPLFVAVTLPSVTGSLSERAPQPLRVTIDPDGSVSDADGTWQTGAGDGEQLEVRGPDWAVLAWVLGRGTSAAHALTAAPPLSPWR